MPELPEVETVRLGLQTVMEGQYIEQLDVRRYNLRFEFPPNFQARVAQQKVTSLSRRAKYVLADLENGDVIIMHLGMSGSFRIEGEQEMRKSPTLYHNYGKNSAHDHVIFHMRNGEKIIYNDPRRFGFMLLGARRTLQQHKLLINLGVEPLGNGLNADYLIQKFQNKTTSLKATLLDQRIIVGLGNIYAAEALWRAQLSPKRPATSITNTVEAPTQLIHAIQGVLQDAIRAGGSSLRDHAQLDGRLGYFQHQFAVYDRAGQPCSRLECAGIIEKFKQNGRSTFWCPVCQR